MSRKRAVTSADFARPQHEVIVAKLSEEDRATCEMVTTYGVEWLRLQKGWPEDQIDEFMGRPGVRREITHLEQMFVNREVTQAKAAFFRLRYINSMVPTALAIMNRVLKGDYIKDGEIVRAPNRLQFEAATQILDRAHVQGAKMGQAQGGASVLDSAAGVNASIQALSPARREVMRRVMGGVVRKGHAIVAAEEEHTEIRTRRRTLLTEVDAAGEPIGPEAEMDESDAPDMDDRQT